MEEQRLTSINHTQVKEEIKTSKTNNGSQKKKKKHQTTTTTKVEQNKTILKTELFHQIIHNGYQ